MRVKIPIDLLEEMTLQQLYKERAVLENRLVKKEYDNFEHWVYFAMLIDINMAIEDKIRTIVTMLRGGFL